MATLIGIQNSTNNEIIICESDDSGVLETTGKILDNLYSNLDSVLSLVNGGTNPTGTGRIDASSTVGIDSFEWGVRGFDVLGKKLNSTSNFLENIHSIYCNYVYLFSEADNKWYVASNDSKEFKSLDEELAKL